MVLFHLHAHSKLYIKSDSDSDAYFAIALPEIPISIISSL